MKKAYRYIIGIFLLLPVCFLMYAFANTAEDIRFFYRISETLGFYNGYKYSGRNLILWAGIILLIIILLFSSFKLVNWDKKLLRNNNLLKVLPFLILSINLIACFFFPRINQFFLQFRDGLDGVIVNNRDSSMLIAFDRDESGNLLHEAIYVTFESFSSDESFYVKLVSIEDEHNQYLYSDDNDIPREVTMGAISNVWSSDKENYKARSSGIMIEIDKMIPAYIDTAENRELLKYKVIIYNEHDSKTFYFYFN